jgi:maltooligosyltrehalose trehalohydrolase
MRRGDLLVVVNAGEVPVVVETDAREVLFQTPSGVVLDGGTLEVPKHAGALLR